LIRSRQPRDDNGIVELVRTELIPISPWQHPRDSRLHSEITQRIRKGATLVAAQSRRSAPLGFLHMEFHQTVLFIDLLAVNSRYQGRQLGTELMLKAEQFGRKKGCTISHILVDNNNFRALRFYHRLGYHTQRALPALKVLELVKSLTT